ncbi:MAG: hypothetical protein COT71_02650 [Candidatus Andersenbacteria bacterium CG10_big_fil_rev_8_21_14_0_10_54_11]|uniref:Uncharacterized protein n=1 Tax=Candidatus Andersenbacteria bacterium CG10_big_fil_rev_8_21_14_0_10_54_11 TaxID=1974485 RepID=A0A2M6WZ47_9BACT|nr:MAG: hypothetical protein COT71_02650 [Candidatus Andersenbacteria bacterium CG10_big_fil_rev_8_21_14_0_10_54_11]
MHETGDAKKRALLRKRQPKPEKEINNGTRKSLLSPNATPAAAPVPAAALTIPYSRFSSFSRRDRTTLLAGSLMAILVISCVNAISRLGFIT